MPEIHSPYSRLTGEDQAALSVILEGFEQHAKRGSGSALLAVLDVAPERMREALLCESLPILIAGHREQTGLTPTLHQLRLANPELRSEIAEIYPWLPASLRLPTEIGGYRVVASIGEGTQSVVLKGQDDVHSAVAIKLTASARHNDLLARERDTLAGCNHRGVVSVLASGTHHDRAYMVMPLLEGETLADRFRSRRASPRETAGVGEQLSDAVAHLHRKGVLHRDIKPANVWIDADDRVTLIDLGMAVPSYRFGEPLPPLDEFHGTPAFMAPEQARGEPGADGKLTDVFAVGGVLCWMLTGTGPFHDATGKEALDRAASGSFDERLIETLQSVPEPLRKVCVEAIAVDPARRPASAACLAERLSELHNRFRRREEIAARPWYASPVAAALLLIVGITGGASALMQPPQRTTVYRPIDANLPEVWVPEVAEAQGIQLERITAADFRVRVVSPERLTELDPSPAGTSRAAAVLLVEVAPRLIDLGDSLTYRFGARRWRSLPFVTSDHRRYALLDERDLELGGTVELRLATVNSYSVAPGPFAYPVDAHMAVAKDRRALLGSRYAAAEREDWLRRDYYRWEVRREFVDRHADVVNAIHFGVAPDRMTQHAPLTTPEEIESLARSAEYGYQRWFRGVSNSAVIWSQLELSDGTRTEPRAHYRVNRYGVDGTSAVARKHLNEVFQHTPLARMRESRFLPIGLAQIDLALTEVRVGPERDQLTLRLPVRPLRRGGQMKPMPTERIEARNENLLNPSFKNRLRQEEPELLTDNGASVNAVSVPPVWKGIWFQGRYRDGTVTPIYYAKNELARRGFRAELLEVSPGGERVDAYVYAFPPYQSPRPGVAPARLLKADAWLHSHLPTGAARVAYFTDPRLSEPLKTLRPGVVYARFVSNEGQVVSACAYRIDQKLYTELIRAASPR